MQPTKVERRVRLVVALTELHSTNSIETPEAIVGTMAQSIQSVGPGRDE
jgi:hypothetical protein